MIKFNPLLYVFAFSFYFQCQALISPNQSKDRKSLLCETAREEKEIFQQTDEAPTCPFSKAFPRYRIDLTRFKEKTKKPWFESPLKNLSRSIQKAKLGQQIQRDEVFLWVSEVDDIATISLLWDRAAKLVANVDIDYSTETIALPDASKQVVKNWVEIIEWMATLPENDFQGTKLRASFVSEKNSDAFPIVRIQQIGSVNTEVAKPRISLEVLNERTQAWVKRMLVEQKICPFTKSINKSGQGLGDVGVPVGSIAYHGSDATNPVQLLSDIWRAIIDMLEAGPSGKQGISSILLAAPAFDNDFDFWAGPIFAMLETSVVAAQAEDRVGVVCFHPRYATPDGKSWPGFGHMHSVPRLEKWYQEYSETKELTSDQVAAGGAWQRRTPHATINVLRADQLQAAESKRMSGSMYTRNIETLISSIGSPKLAEDLEQERQLGRVV
jgi:hypothetical protein